jgi:nucleoside-diphosphate-sugar epimerase
VQTNLGKLVETAIQATGKTTDFQWEKMNQRSWDTSHWVADISLAKERLDWHPGYDLIRGLRATWNWFKAHKHFYP